MTASAERRAPPGRPDAAGPRRRRVVRALAKQLYDIEGFVEAADRDYDPVRDAMSLMGLGRPK